MEQAHRRKRKPGRPPKALAVAAAGQAPKPSLHADTQPVKQRKMNKKYFTRFELVSHILQAVDHAESSCYSR
eukprot:365925-Chlamydomonas_euryale.AAC.7